MLLVSVDGKQAIERVLRDFPRQNVPRAIEVALNKTARQAKEAVVDEMRRVFDRPTDYTLRSLVIQPAVARQGRFEARVAIKDRTTAGTTPTKAIGHHVGGGARALKRFEVTLQRAGLMPTGYYAVPADGPDSAARIDPYGNLAKGQITQMLSQLRVQITGGYTRALTREQGAKGDKLRRKAYGRAGGQYVAIPRRRGKLSGGVYLATGRDFGNAMGYGRTGRLQPVLRFVRSVDYADRLQMERVARTEVERVFEANLSESLAREMRRAEAR